MYNTVLPVDFQEFEKRFPDAASFLRHKSLQNELAHLERQPDHRMNDWRIDRRNELRKLFSDIGEIGGMK